MGKERIAQQQTSAWLLLRNHCIILRFVRHQITWRMHDKYQEMPPAAGQASSAGSGEAGRGPGLCDPVAAGPPPGLDQGCCLCTTTLRTAARRASLGRGRHDCQSAKLAGGSERGSREVRGTAWWSGAEDSALLMLCLGSVPGQRTESFQAPWHGKKKKNQVLQSPFFAPRSVTQWSVCTEGFPKWGVRH